MKSLDFSRLALSNCAAAAMLAGCGGSQPLVGAPGAMPQSSAIATHAGRGTSWILPEAKRGDLLYLAGWSTGSVYVYTYPQGRFVGALTDFILPIGECNDSAGDVFVVAYSNESESSSTIYEFAHGGTEPIATLSDPETADDCAVDPTTGNLAASGNAVAIFKDATGDPTMYYSSGYGFLRCGYDDRGNLYLTTPSSQFADQEDLVRLASGSSDFERIQLNATLYNSSDIWPSPQWDGKHMTVSSDPYRKPITLYRLHVTGSNATVISSATLSTTKNSYSGDTWIKGKAVIGVGKRDNGVGQDTFLWPSPKGGEDPRVIVERVGGKVGNPLVSGVTVSVAESR